jgi:hypothetical protein
MIATNGSGPRTARPSRRTLWIVGGTAVAVIVISAALGIALALVGVGVPSRAEPLPGLLTGPAPWGPNTHDLRARLDRLGKPLIPRATSLPFAHLRISAAGRSVPVPAGIGVLPKSGSVAPLFSSSGAAIDHVGRPARLGLFFKIWGVRFTKTCLGGYCGKLTVVVNGARVPGDPRRLLLRPGQEIVVSIQR